MKKVKEVMVHMHRVNKLLHAIKKKSILIFIVIHYRQANDTSE